MYRILVIALTLFVLEVTAQNCVPSDACVNAPKLCMNGFITSTGGYTPGGEPLSNCPIGPHNDSWIAFMPTLSSLSINVTTLGSCSSGSGIDIMIHTSCNTDPIDCVNCQYSGDVGGGFNFIPGQTYYLRIDGCNGAICPVQITVTPSNAIALPPDRINPKWPATGFIAGPLTIPCPGKEAT
jgi:hypothetical protein